MSAVPATPAPLAPDAKPMRGPSALGGGFRRFLDLTWMIGVTEYRLTYFGSALGYLWSLMRPLMFFGVLYVVFSQIVNFGDDIPNYPMMLLMNIVLFSFFQDVTERSVTAVVDSEALVRKMHFPRLVIPLAVVMTGLLNLVLNLLAVAIFFVAYGLDPQWTWLLFPVVLLPLVVFTAAAAMLLSALYVRFRDVAPIWSVATTALFYGTPVLYAIDVVPESAQRYLLFNPLADLLELARLWVIDPGASGPADAIGGAAWLLVPIAIFVGVCVAAWFTFEHEAPIVAERL